MESTKPFILKQIPINIPLTVWMETPSAEIRQYMKLPSSGKVLAVREPKTPEHGYTYYLTRQTNGTHKDDRKATIEALCKKYNKSARVILKELSEGASFALDYYTKLPFLDRKRGQLYDHKELGPDSPEYARIKKAMHNDIVDKADQFPHSKRFKQKA